MLVKPKSLLAILCFLSLVLLPFASLTKPAASYEVPLHKDPLFEYVDLLVDGSITPVIVNLTEFPAGSWMMRIIWSLEWRDNDIDFDEFANVTELTNGTVVRSGTTNLTNDEPIKSNHEFAYTSYDLRIDSDDKNPKNNHLSCRWTFWKSITPWGIRWTENNSLQFIVQDDLSSIADEFHVFVEGFEIPSNPINPANDPRLDMIGWMQNQYAIFIALFVVGIMVIVFFKMILPLLRM